MPARPQLVAEMNFGGGLNLASDPLHVKDTESTDCQNVDFDVRGSVKKRLGRIVRVGDVDSAADYVFPYNTPGGITRLIAARSGQVVKFIDSGFVLQTPGGAPGAQSASTTHHGVAAAGKAYVVNNVDASWKYDGTTATRLGTTANATGNQPKAKYVVFYKGRLYFGNCNAGANRSRLIYTGSDANPGDVEYFKATSLIDFDPDDGDEITALVPFLDQIVVFKRSKIMMLRGDTPNSFRVVLGNASLGCAAPRSAVAWEKGVMFLSSRGVFSYDGARATRISEKIDSALGALPSATLANAVGVVFGNRYFLAVSAGGSFNDTLYIFDFNTATWTRYTDWSLKSMTVWPRLSADELWGVDDFFDNQYDQYLIGNSDGSLNQPAAPTLAQFATGGTLSNGTYRYKVTAVNATGETMASATADITLTGGTATQRIEITAPTVVGATAYGFYGRTTGSQLKITQQAATLFSDTGSITPAGASPTSDLSARPINAFWTSKWFDFGVPERKKTGRRVYLFFKSSGNYNVSVDIQKDYQADKKTSYAVNLNPGGLLWGGGTWGGGVWGLGLDTIRKRITGLGTNAAFRAKVFDQSINPWIFEGMSFVLIPRNLV